MSTLGPGPKPCGGTEEFCLSWPGPEWCIGNEKDVAPIGDSEGPLPVDPVLIPDCEDVPRLMREGFHWTVANVIREEGFVEDSPALERGWNGTKGGVPFLRSRHFFLRDLQQPPRWTAHLHARAPNDAILSSIRLEKLSVDTINVAAAWSLGSKLIYFYNIANPQDAFNAIYDDMSMEGWWHWPRKRQHPKAE
ncbi:Uu.00g068460.m01.CDS01 [Anthostomella pinea]|uniref:Uu.00g068460.m01.CDS01 n=1 Tax=Anthostomella pinea TaxID=933095 RepID=A0AAI8VUD1_9PEZI|nr:Uu.00g068460.m01.CDS01 [Anthostomella pinea]